MKQEFFLIENEGAEPFSISINGRKRWALESLIAACEKGCTPIDNPAPRRSGYVHKLRGFGVNIETVHEGHKGPYPGTHARYVLRSRVTRQNAVAA